MNKANLKPCKKYISEINHLVPPGLYNIYKGKDIGFF